jgi:hypothetical protein
MTARASDTNSPSEAVSFPLLSLRGAKRQSNPVDVDEIATASSLRGGLAMTPKRQV